jgi:hypothetical protein
MKKLLALLPLILSLTGCAIVPHIPILKSIYSGPTTRETRAVTKAQGKTDKERAELEAAQVKFDAKVVDLESNKVQTGSAFVYGTSKALERAPQDDPAVKLAENLNDVAQQALPKPSTSDTIAIDNAVTDSLGINPVRGANEIVTLREHLAETEKQLSAEQARHAKDVAGLQSDLDSAISKERATSSQVAVKANKFDEANSLWGSTKLFFSNGVHVLFSLLIVGIIGWVVWKGGQLAAAIYAPPVALGMQQIQSLSTKELSAGFSQLVKAGESFKTYIQNSPLTADAKAAVADLFRRAHLESQDQTVQAAIKTLTNGPK